MTSLDLIDGRHEELVSALPPLSSKLAAVRLLAHLRELPSLQGSPQTLFYHVDAARRLCALILDRSPISGHPGFLRDLLEMLSSYSDSPAAPRVQTLHPAIGRLRMLLAAEFAVRGQWPEVRAVLPDVSPPAEGRPTLESFLAALADRAEAVGLQWPFHLRDPVTSVGKGSVLTVLVDGPSVPEAYREAYLTLLSVRVTVHKRRGDEPHVVRSRDDSGEDLPLGDDLKDLVREATDHALRLLGPHIARRAERQRFEIEITLRRPDPVTTVQGRSILLPLAPVLAEQLSEQLNLPFALIPNRSIVWTGDVDQHGTLATVGDVTLKACRVAASRADGLALPAIDPPAATTSVHGGAQPRLHLHRLTTLSDVTARSELMATPGRSLPTRIATTAKQRARPLGVAGVSALGVLLVALAYSAPRLASWLDNAPDAARWSGDGSQIELLNEGGRVVGRFTSPARTEREPVLHDIDRNGIPEVYVGTGANDSLSGRVLCLDPQGSVRWEFRGGYGTDPDSLLNLANPFGSMGIYFHDLTHDGLDEVVAVFNHGRSSDGQLNVLSPDGRRMGSFWNPGQFSYPMSRGCTDCAGVVFADIDHDGFDEIIGCGNNNPCFRAALVILDPRSINGLGFDCRDSLIEATWQSYVLFPRLKRITDALGVRRLAARDLLLTHRGNLPIIRLSLTAYLPDVGFVNLVHYLLDYDLNLVDVYVGDHFVQWAQTARAKGLIDFPLSSPEFQSELRQIEVIPGPVELLPR